MDYNENRITTKNAFNRDYFMMNAMFNQINEENLRRWGSLTMVKISLEIRLNIFRRSTIPQKQFSFVLSIFEDS